MNTLQAEEFCLSLPKVTEDMPFGDDILTFRIENKIFAILLLGRIPQRIALKCDPEKAISLREEYDAIQAAYHLNKKHWNQLELNRLPGKLIKELIIHSYRMVAQKLPKKLRTDLLQALDNYETSTDKI